MKAERATSSHGASRRKGQTSPSFARATRSSPSTHQQNRRINIRRLAVSLPTFLWTRWHHTHSIRKSSRGGNRPVLLLYQFGFRLVSNSRYINGIACIFKDVRTKCRLRTAITKHEVITEAHEKTARFPRSSHAVGSTDELYPTTSTQKNSFQHHYESESLTDDNCKFTKRQNENT